MAVAVQVAGAVAILAAFALLQRRVVTTASPAYLLLNLSGGAATAFSAYVEAQWGFTILQTVWALVAAWGLFMRFTRARVR